MKIIKTDYGYYVYKESDFFDIIIYNEDFKIVAALTKSDIKKILCLSNYEKKN